jgi:rod shape-determining protein MreD
MLQVTVSPRFEVLGAHPSLVLVAIVVSAWTLGPRVGMLLACGGGLLLDLASAGPLGPHAVAFLPAAYLAGAWSRNALLGVLSAAAGTLVYSCVLLVAYALPIETAARAAVVAAIYNAVLVALALIPVISVSLGRITRRAQA